MEHFNGRLAVVTGGGSGMGRELVRQLAAGGCDVATCDLSAESLKETKEITLSESPDRTVTTHICDVSDEAAVLSFRDQVLSEHDTDSVDLLFNNAGLSGGGSLFADSREAWDYVFGVCWGGVYFGTRAFLDALVASEQSHIVNTSSVNGFWASLGPDTPHTAYSTAKFAVKGFSEALITDLRHNAPHVKVSVVMPGHIGTSIVANSAANSVDPLTSEEAEFMSAFDAVFQSSAPMTAADAAGVILDGVRDDKWRILVGEDAHALDKAVRNDPEAAYDPEAPSFAGGGAAAL